MWLELSMHFNRLASSSIHGTEKNKDVSFVPDVSKLLPFLVVIKYATDKYSSAASLHCYYTIRSNSIASGVWNVMAKLYLHERKSNDNSSA